VIKEYDPHGACNMHGKDDKFTTFIGKPEDKKPRHQWEIDKINLKHTRCQNAG
jgi:hypothetical protein